jgi:uncharacterized membrane protein YjgN (DUF898 family)
MNSNSNDGFFGSLVTWLIVGLLALVALKVVLVTIGLALRFTLALALTIGPLLLVGWLAMKALRHFAGGAEPTGTH